MNIALNILSLLWKRRSIWATMFFIAIVGFLDENSLSNLLAQWNKNAELKEEIAKCEDDYKEATTRLKLLSSSREAVEEVARVNLLMKSNDEDVYIVEDKE